jgi:hypothetical protein
MQSTKDASSFELNLGERLFLVIVGAAAVAAPTVTFLGPNVLPREFTEAVAVVGVIDP